MMAQALPPGFEALEPFVAHWARDDFQARFITRYESSYEDIQAFYDAIMPMADRILQALEQTGLDDMPDAHRTLFKLLMALAHIAVAVERHRQPRPRSITWPTTLEVTQGSFPP
ncbi:hypothetical protein [Sphingobium chlorophenolicum]|uniref:Uncharacterized protein n=1 Tax=Sphingobium chlorophenolicum TaxID=46429 RepID=A0A081REC7_SPHCR|nr:hypothetical protein [Sphingobium chlorophenolicum]KEQ53550.1 hypothetical protein BV95_02131 [Sphingobium chlorophenolicum]